MAPIAAEGLNLFISREEMFRTLGKALFPQNQKKTETKALKGVWAEMFYVSDGEVNEYSTKFPYILAENITNLAFTWNNPNRRDTV
jgi:hypothetical protein